MPDDLVLPLKSTSRIAPALAFASLIKYYKNVFEYKATLKISNAAIDGVEWM
jgi:hypothetical protein